MFSARFQLNGDVVARSIGQILSEAEIAFRRADRGVAEGDLNLLERGAAVACQTGVGSAQIVRSEAQTEPGSIRHDDLIDSLSADAVSDQVIGLIDGTEQPPLANAGGCEPDLQAGPSPAWNGNRTRAVVFAYQVHDDPAAVAFLELLDGKRSQLIPSQSGADEQGEQSLVAPALQRGKIWSVEQALYLFESQPVAQASASPTGATDSGDSRCHGRIEQPVIGSLERQLSQD